MVFFWVTPKFNFSVGVDGEVVGAVSVGTQKTSTHTYIKEYKNNSWNTITEASSIEEPIPVTLSGEAMIELYLKGAIHLRIFEVLGVETYAKYFVRAEAVTNTSNIGVLDYCIDHGIKVGITLRDELFSSLELTPLEISILHDELLPCDSISINSGGIFIGDTILTTQEEVNTFGNNNYVKIDGSLVITGNNISDLSPLSSITEITGTLRLFEADKLIDFLGMENLKKIGNNLIVNHCNKLRNFNGLVQLDTIGGSFTIGFCSELSEMKGCESLSFIRNTLLIENNPSLLILGNNLNIIYIGEDLRITNNPNLERIGWFDKVNYLGGIAIKSNSKLKDVSGFNNATFVGSPSFQENPALETINGFSNLERLYSINIQRNENLNNISGFQNVKKVDSRLAIEDNINLSAVNGFPDITEAGNLIIYLTNIRNVDFLENLSQLNSLNILNNLVLDDFCGLDLLIRSNNLSGTYNITNNAYNPTIEDILNGNCSQ